MKPFLSILLAVALLATSLPAIVSAQSFDCSAVTEISSIECEALVAFYNSTNGANWWRKDNWLVTNTPSNWMGVTVAGGKVTSISFFNNGLSGSLPSELGHLSGLINLDLGRNSITGIIPAELGNLAALQSLQLNNNLLSGSIPKELGQLSNLTGLWLFNNQLTGEIPFELVFLTQLQALSLNDNQLTGILWSALGDQLTNLEYLNLRNNNIGGPIPAQLGNLSLLDYLNLSGNSFYGSIPPELGNLLNLTQLYLGTDFGQEATKGNRITGCIPSTFGGLTKLEILALGNMGLGCTIPPELGNLTALTGLYLEDNRLSGEIPATFGNLTLLTRLYLYNNELSGTIPTVLGNLSNLDILYLGGNGLAGNIPAELGNLSVLRFLELDGNQLSGSIPVELGNLSHILGLNLSDNQLNGDIPDSIANLIHLDPSYSDLDYNQLNVPAGYPDSTDPLQVFLSQKDPDWQLYQSVQSPIGASGGVVTSLDGNTTLNIPQNSLPDGARIVFVPKPHPGYDAPGLQSAQNSFQIFAYDSSNQPITSFSQPISVTIQYSDEDIVGISEEELRLYYWNTEKENWSDAATTCPDGNYTRQMAENKLSLPLCHLSDFTLGNLVYHYLYLPSVIK